MHLQITSDNDGGSTCTGGMGGGGVGWRGTRSEHMQASVHSLIQRTLNSMRCQGTGKINLLVISRARYIENLDFTNFWQNKQNVHYINL